MNLLHWMFISFVFALLRYCAFVSFFSFVFCLLKFMVRAEVGLTTREATRRVEDIEL